MRIAHVLIAAVLFLSPLAAGQAGHSKEPHHHTEGSKLQNPVPADAASIEAGKKAYGEQCAACHGDTGKGDGPMAPFTGDPPPSDLTDATWRHGGSDGEIFLSIRDGIEGTGMQHFKDMDANEIWNLVNFLKTLAPKPAQNH